MNVLNVFALKKTSKFVDERSILVFINTNFSSRGVAEGERTTPGVNVARIRDGDERETEQGGQGLDCT